MGDQGDRGISTEAIVLHRMSLGYMPGRASAVLKIISSVNFFSGTSPQKYFCPSMLVEKLSNTNILILLMELASKNIPIEISIMMYLFTGGDTFLINYASISILSLDSN